MRADSSTQERTAKISVATLTAMVVGSMVGALLLTTAVIQVVLFVTLLSDDAFTFALDLTSALSLIPFLLAAGYALKLALGRGGHVVALATGAISI
jgi:hypothetical protein